MFAKRLLPKAIHHSKNFHHGSLEPSDLEPRLIIHYGIPTTASILAFDSIQRLLAIGTLDGRIKVIGGDGIEGLLVSPKQFPYKDLEFLQNQGFLVGILNDNDIQVWNLDSRSLACSLQWESNITAFSVISGSQFMYVGNEYGLVSVMKYDTEDGKLLKLPYTISANSLREAAGYPYENKQPIVGVLPQPGSSGNRVLIAFEDGLLILWDASEDQIVFIGGGKDLQLKNECSDDCNTNREASVLDDRKEILGEKEISSLSWASSSGSILAVGYVDGDILFWNLSHVVSSRAQEASMSSQNVVKLQLSSSERRLPVIVLQWSNSQKSRNGCDGQLFIYGGDEIGSEEVLTVLTLEWTPGLETVRCVGRADLTLTGSFADMILLPTGSSNKDDFFVLTSPGQLQFYESSILTKLMSPQERRPSVSSIEYPTLIPMADPSMTVAKLVKLTGGLNTVKDLSEVVSAMRVDSVASQSGSSKWPLTGGVPIEPSTTTGVDRLYLAGYSDGSVRIWNATNPVLSYICCVEGEVEGVKVAGTTSPVLKLDFFPGPFMLVVGNECGLVRVYDFRGCSDVSKFNFVTESTREVHTVAQQKGPYCEAIFSLGSAVQELKFSNSGEKLAIGLESGLVAVCDMTSFSILFSVDGCSGSRVASLIWTEQPHACCPLSPDQSEKQLTGSNNVEELIFILSQDSKINVIDGTTGKIISNRPLHLKKESVALTIYVIEGNSVAAESSRDQQLHESPEDHATEAKSAPESAQIKLDENENNLSQPPPSGDAFDSFILLCCEDSLQLYSTKSVIEGNGKSIQKVKYAKPCCWTTIFKMDEKVGIISLLQTGVTEIRSLPGLQLVEEGSLMAMLRWNFKANMNKTISSDENGHIVLANGSEFALLSLIADDSEQRTLKNLSSLHDKVLAAAADAACNVSSSSKKKQRNAPGILGGLVKSFKVGKAAHTDCTAASRSNFTHLDGIFFKSPFSETSLSMTADQEARQLDIDDIEIDDTPIGAPMSSDDVVFGKGKKTDRDKLLEGGTETDVRPRLRTPEEIRATYRKAGDASSAALQARNKLMERQEKLERISQRTAELQSGAEDFASLANELAKTMENRKWWHI